MYSSKTAKESPDGTTKKNTPSEGRLQGQISQGGKTNTENVLLEQLHHDR